MSSTDPARTFIVIPAFNEARALGPVVRSLAPHTVVVVDDGSRDDTGAVAAAAGATVLRHAINLGQGAALQTGLDHALASGADYVVTFDADGQHDPGDIAHLLAPLQHDGYEVTLGSRFLGGSSNIPPGRRILLRTAAAVTSFTTGLHLTDVHNGLRAFSGAACRKIRLRQNRMAHASEILRQISEHRMRFKEVAVNIRYTEYSLAKGQRLTGALDIVIDLLKERIIR